MSKRPGDPGYAPGWCIHYRYNRDVNPGAPDTCEAGVDYAQFRGVKFDRRPCFLDKETGSSKPDAMPCEKIRRPTAEEIAGHEAWLEEHMNDLRKVMLGIRQWREKWKGKSHAEIMACPACNGRLHLSIAAYNGHVHGKCETNGCVSWAE